MNKLTADYAAELHEAVKLFISQPLNFPLSRGQIMEVARIALPILEQHKVDSEALAVSREIMKIMCGPMPQGGSVQLMAQVQCLVIDAMKVAQGDNSLSRQPDRATNQNGEQ